MKTSPRTRPILGVLALLALGCGPVGAQQKRALDHADYAIWNRIDDEVLSADGGWLAYRLVPGDGDARLVIRALRGDRELSIERGVSARFSADSRYLVALVDPMESAVDAARGGGRRAGDGPKDSLAVIRLSDLTVQRVADVKSFRMPADAGGWFAYLLEAVKAPEDEEGGDEPAAGEEDDAEGEPAPRLDDGTTLVVRTFESGNERNFPHVVDYAFAADGTSLAYTASGGDGAADGVYRVEPGGDARTLAEGEGRYLQLAVSDRGRVAFLSDRDDRGSEAPDFALYTSDGGVAVSAVASGSGSLPSGWAPSEHGALSFSESGTRVFFGTAPAPEPAPEDPTPEHERVEVDIWNWKDPYLQPMQLVQAQQEKERTWQAMVDLSTGRTVQLASPELPEVAVASDGDGALALGVSDMAYRQLVSWDGRYSDLYVVDVTTGDRTLVAEMVRGGGSLSPTGRYITHWDGFEKKWFAIDTQTGTSTDLTGGMSVPFHDVLDDHPDALRPYGAAGWTEGDAAFVVYDEFDVWAIDPAGARAPRNLTEGRGRATDTRFRIIDLDADDPFVPSGEDVLLSAFHATTKASGVYRDRFDRERPPEVLITGDARFAGVTKAKDADVLTFTRSTFSEFPDVWVTDLAMRSPRKVTSANPQQPEYTWGTAEIVQWSSNDGIPLQGILYKPDGFNPSEEYPMMVYFYERSSDGLHQYFVPAPGGSSIDRSFYVSRGYLLFVPDIPYRIGYPGESALDAVVPGVLNLVERGFVDRARIGVQGHSWGGYQIAYMVTRTDLFAAAEAGAPVANMVSAYGGIRWQTGMSRAFQYERTQSRIGGSLWETPLRYIENSPIFTADKIRTPLLMMHNDEDGAVPWYQGIELFVALRRLGQPVWMLNYNGEAHGLREEHNRKDWAIRMQQFFDHYLMDAPAPVWMEEGVPAILKGQTLGLELTTKKVISEQGDEGR